MDVVAIGNIVADFVAAPVSKLPGWGELYSIERPITLNIGGNAAIFSACSSKLGLKTSLMGKIGDDELGSLLLSKLNAAKVDTSRIKSSKKNTTSATLVIANDDGERSFFHHIGANKELTQTDIDFKFMSNAKAVLLCSYFIMPGLEGVAAKEILKRAKKMGLTTFFDVAWDPTGTWELGDILEYVDVFLPNSDEITRLTKKKNVQEAAHEMIDAGVKIIAVKMGGQGCYVESVNGERFELKAHEVKAIDTTGAGDTFNAGFVYGTLAGWEMEKCARFANAAAAFSVTKLGGTTGAPTVEEVDELLKN